VFGLILVILGGTCSGKTEFALACEKFGFPKVITNTTREKRIDDKENSYHFLSKEQFLDKIANGEMLEYAEYNGNLYGTSMDSLSDNCVIVLEPNGLESFKRILGDRVYSIFLDVSDEERIKRGIARGDNIEILNARVEEEKELFTEKVKNSVDFLIRDLRREEIDEVIENNLDTLYTK